jgi:O-antigen/teichoic acid export membrane protein
VTGKTLQARSALAAAWSGGNVLVQRGIALITNLIMAELLVPDAFGLMAIIVAVHMLMELMSDIGIRQSIVRDKRGEDLLFLQVAWSVQILRGTALAGIVLLCAFGFLLAQPLLEGSKSVYAHPELPGLLAVSSLAIIFRGFESTAMYIDARNLRQHRISMIEVGAQVITLGIMLGLAQIEASVWILLIGMVSGAGLRMVFTHLIFRTPRMRLAWDREIVRDLWVFGRWLIGGSLAGFVVNHGDRFLLGAFLDVTAFGFYTIAALWMQTGAMLFTRITDQVVYPAFSESLRSAPSSFLAVLARFRKLFDLATLVVFGALIFGGSWLIELLYPDTYLPAGAFLSLLSFRFLSRRQMPLGAVLLAKGKSADVMLSAISAAIALVVSVPLCYFTLGIEASILAVALAPIAGSAALIWRVRKLHVDMPVLSDVLVLGTILIGVVLYYVFVL